jgi:ABC-2 type transport system permease protein
MFRKYTTFLRASMMNILIYRGTVILWILVDLFKFFMLIFLWKSVFTNQEVIGGFYFNEMITYFLISGFTTFLTIPDTHYAMSEEIRQGKISLYLIKPLSYKRRLFYENLGRVLGISMLVFPVSVIMTVIVKFLFDIQFSFSVIRVIGFIAYLPLILAFCFEFSFTFGTLMIYTQNDFGLAMLMVVIMTAISGQLVPLALYPQAIQRVLEYLPFKYISYPPLIFLNKVLDDQILLGLGALLGWIILFKLFNFLFFRASLKKMVVFGG